MSEIPVSFNLDGDMDDDDDDGDEEGDGDEKLTDFPHAMFGSPAANVTREVMGVTRNSEVEEFLEAFLGRLGPRTVAFIGDVDEGEIKAVVMGPQFWHMMTRVLSAAASCTEPLQELEALGSPTDPANEDEWQLMRQVFEVIARKSEEILLLLPVRVPSPTDEAGEEREEPSDDDDDGEEKQSA